MKILSITILHLKQGPDRIYIKTDLPDAVFPFQENLLLHFNAARGTGRAYVEKHFPGVEVFRVSETQ